METVCTPVLLLACLTSIAPLAASIVPPPTTAAHVTANALPQDINADGPRLSPFRGMRMQDDILEVQVDDVTWYELVKIDKVNAKTLLKQSHKLCGRNWWKRLREDLPALLIAMGHDVGIEVDLELRNTKTEQAVTMKGVEMTLAKRQGLLRGTQPGAFRPARMARTERITTDTCERDLAELVRLLDDQFSYRHRKDIDLDALVTAAKSRLKSPTHRQLLEEVDLIVKAFGDGHTRVNKSPNRPESTGYMPFLIAKAKGGYVAFAADRSRLVDPTHPYVIEIAGRPIEDWLETGREHATQGSAHFLEFVSIRSLRFHNEQRRLLGRRADDDVKLVFAGTDRTTRVKLDLASRAPVYGTWPRTQTRRLDDDIGYLRIPKMTRDRAALDRIDTAMDGFRDTRGLIIDVRGNGGGTRDILRRLFPYLMMKSNKPHVANIAAYRLPAGAGDRMKVDGYLANRKLYPLSWRGWSTAQRQAIAKAARAFKPEWKLPKGAFSTWHYYLLDRSDNAAAYHYDKPIAVLMDTGCFSATDIFLGALKGWHNVTMIGLPSGGGSGRSRSHHLPLSGIEVRISTMASFRPNGQLYEGRGIRPDIEIEPIATDFVLGGTDTALDAAIDVIKG